MASKKKKKNKSKVNNNNVNIQKRNVSKKENNDINVSKDDSVNNSNVNIEENNNEIKKVEEIVSQEKIVNKNEVSDIKKEENKDNAKVNVEESNLNKEKKDKIKNKKKNSIKKEKIDNTKKEDNSTIENQKENKDLNQEENNSKNLKEENKEKSIIKQEDTPEYVKEMLMKKRKKKIFGITIFVILIFLIFCITIFALVHSKVNVISKGIYIRNIDVSNLSKDDAIIKVNNVVDKELSQKIDLKYDDEVLDEFEVSDIEFKYNVEEAVNEAYEYAKTGNILVNMYEVLASKIFSKNITLDYTYNEELFNTCLESINANLPGVVVNPSYYIDSTKLYVLRGTDGILIDKEMTKNLVINALVNRKGKEINVDVNEELSICVNEAKADLIDMQKIYDDVHQAPQDAYYETDPYQIYADKDGIDLNESVSEAQKEIDSEVKEEYVFDLKITKASVTINDLGMEAFPSLLSDFTTKYDASNTNRSTNLQIAAGKINGTVIMPGETFSYNQVVGQRTIEEGYKDAKIYADGGVVDGLAGGICQISSTLYNAVLLADLEIVERMNHSYTTSYVEAGRDATVVWGTKDFKFKNTRNYPIKIESSVKNGIAEFKIYGMSEQQDYDQIKILPFTTGTIPTSTVEVQDSTLAPGQRVVQQAGHQGLKVTTYKVKYLNGVEVSRELLSNDTYQPMKQIVRVGPIG